MNCPRCGERMTTICIDFGGGYICRPCTLKQFAPPPSEQARDRIRDAVIERAKAKRREEPELHADDSEGGTI